MWVFYILIVLWVLFGLTAFIIPKKAKSIYEKLITPTFCKIWGVVALLMGYFMWTAALSLKIPLVAYILAIIAALKGIVLLVLPYKFVTKMNLGLKMNEMAFRIFGIVSLLISYFVYTLL